MLKQLTDYYQPDALIHREKQIEEIEKVFDNFQKFGVGTNKLIIGSSGTGKTATIKYLMNKRNSCIYLSAHQEKTSNRILRQFCPKNILTIDKVLKYIIEHLKQNPKILIIDEINKVNRIYELFDDLNSIYRETQIPIILITNRRDLIDKMPDDAKKTLFFTRVEFNPYDSNQMYDILKNRLDRLENNIGNLPEELLKYICAKSVQEGGSARIALDIALRCIMEQSFTYEFVDKFILEKQKSDFESYINNLRPLEKQFLESIIDIYSKDMQINPSIIQKYLPGKVPQQISQLITKFEQDFIISTKYINKGKSGGRLRTIEIAPEIFSKLICFL